MKITRQITRLYRRVTAVYTPLTAGRKDVFFLELTREMTAMLG
jgi:hypothetical protein